MKYLFIAILVVFTNIGFSQKEYLITTNDSIKLFDEFTISLNRTDLGNYNTNIKTGFGFGIIHTELSNKILNVLFGIEYDNTKYFFKTMHVSHFSYIKDVTYSINSLSIPIFLRVNIGKKTKIFIDLGIYGDLNILAWKKGTMHVYYPNENNEIEYYTSKINEASRINTINYGVSLGLGVNFPILKYNFISKIDYKFGFRDLYDDYNYINNRYFRIMIGIKI